MRNNILNDVSNQLNNLKKLENIRNSLREDIDIYKNTIAEQKRQAELLLFAQSLEYLPDQSEISEKIKCANNLIQELVCERKEIKNMIIIEKKRIDNSIRLKNEEYEGRCIQDQIKILKESIIIEEQKESASKIAYSQLSSRVLQLQSQMCMLEKDLSEEEVEPIDLDALKQKSLNLQDQLIHLETKNKAFSLEYSDITMKLESMRKSQEEFNEKRQKVSSINTVALKHEIIESAAINMGLRMYKPLTSDASEISKYTFLVDEVEDLIKIANESIS